EIGVGNHYVFRLPADPSAHVYITICRTRPRRVNSEADTGLAFTAVPAAAACDVKRYGNDVADFQHLDVAAFFNYLTGDLMTQNQPLGSRRAAAHHVLVRTANIGSHDVQDHAMRSVLPSKGIRLALGHPQLGIGNRLNLDLTRLDVCNSTIACHFVVSFLLS